MTGPQSLTQHQPQIFITYALHDHAPAMKIRSYLESTIKGVWFDAYELMPGREFTRVQESIVASDYIIFLLSPSSVESPWINYEITQSLFQDWAFRNIMLIPVLIADCQIPPFLTSYRLVDMRTNFDNGLSQLANIVGAIPSIEVASLDEQGLVDLTQTLLKNLGFQDIVENVNRPGVDLVAQYSARDPFGVPRTETWHVECKRRANRAVSIDALRQFATYLHSQPAQVRGLLVTNGQLTSVAREWLSSLNRENEIYLRVIDITELKPLVLNHTDVIRRFLGTHVEPADEQK